MSSSGRDELLTKLKFDHSAGRISDADYVRLGLFALEAPDSNPARYHSITDSGEVPSAVYENYVTLWSGLSADEQATLRAFAAQPLRGSTYTLTASDPSLQAALATAGPTNQDPVCYPVYAIDLMVPIGLSCALDTAHFHIMFTDNFSPTTGVDWTDHLGRNLQPGTNGTPDTVDEYAHYLEIAYGVYTQDLSYPAPARIDVTLDTDGKAKVDPKLGILGFDGTTIQLPLRPTTEGKLRYAAFHEPFHVVQNQYADAESDWGDDHTSWMAESTAEWATNQVDRRLAALDPGNPFLTQTPWEPESSGSVWAYLYSPENRIDSAPGINELLTSGTQTHEYGTFLFWVYMEERWPGSVKAVWEKRHTEKTRDAIHDVVTDRNGGDWNGFLLEYDKTLYLMAFKLGGVAEPGLSEWLSHVTDQGKLQGEVNYPTVQPRIHHEDGPTQTTAPLHLQGLGGVHFVELKTLSAPTVVTVGEKFTAAPSSGDRDSIATRVISLSSPDSPLGTTLAANLCGEVVAPPWKETPGTGGREFSTQIYLIPRAGCSAFTLIVTNASWGHDTATTDAAFITWQAGIAPTTNGSVSGFVYDEPSGKPIADASVATTGASATTDASGAYHLAGLGTQDYVVTAIAPGHVSGTAVVSVTGWGDSSHDFSLARTVIPMTSLPLVPLDARPATDALPPPAASTSPSAVVSFNGDSIVGGTYTTTSGGLEGYLSRVTQAGKYRWSVPLPGALSVGGMDIGNGLIYLAAQDVAGAFVAAYDSTGARRWKTPFNARYVDAYVAAIPGGGVYFCATYSSSSGSYANLTRLDASGSVAASLYPIDSSIGVDGAYASHDGSLIVGEQTHSGTTISRYANGVLDPTFAIAMASGGRWTMDRSSDSVYVVGRTSAGDTVTKYVSGAPLWSRDTKRVAGAGSSSLYGIAADFGSVYFARKATVSDPQGHSEPTVGVSVADGADGFIASSNIAVTNGSASPFGMYDPSITGFSVSGGRASVVGTTDPYVFSSSWDSEGGQWPSLERVNPYGFLQPFSVYGNNGTLDPGPSQVLAISNAYLSSVALDNVGDRYVSVATGSTSTLTKYGAQSGLALWTVQRPTGYDQVVVVSSGQHAGVYVAGVGNYTGNAAAYTLSDGSLLWSQDPTAAVESGTSFSENLDLDVRPDGTVFFAGGYGTNGYDPRGFGTGVYVGIAGPNGVTGIDDFSCVPAPVWGWNSCASAFGVWAGEVHSTPDGSKFYLAKSTNSTYQILRYNQDLTVDTSFNPIPAGVKESFWAQQHIAVDSAGSLYVVDYAQDPSGQQVSGYTVAKYDSVGGRVWSVAPHLSGNGIGVDGSVMVWAGGRLYVVESLSSASGVSGALVGDYYLVAVLNASTGALLDEETIASDRSDWFGVQAIAANGSGQVLVGCITSYPYWGTFIEPFQWNAP